MTQPVPNLKSKLVDKFGFLIPPWNSFFQQLVQPAPAVVSVGVSSTPFTANANGTLIIKGATTITLTRGTVSISLTGQIIIPIAVSDTVSWTGTPTSVQFLGA
jgi:hypothetical protein